MWCHRSSGPAIRETAESPDYQITVLPDPPDSPARGHAKVQTQPLAAAQDSSAVAVFVGDNASFLIERSEDSITQLPELDVVSVCVFLSANKIANERMVQSVSTFTVMAFVNCSWIISNGEDPLTESPETENLTIPTIPPEMWMRTLFLHCNKLKCESFVRQAVCVG